VPYQTAAGRRGQRVKSITWLSPHARPIVFPPADSSVDEPAGLLAAGGDHPCPLVGRIPRGIFPWYSPGQPVLWWSPDPRLYCFPKNPVHRVALGKTLRNGGSPSS